MRTLLICQHDAPLDRERLARWLNSFSTGGERYLHLRRLLLRHGTEVRWGDRTQSTAAV
jgi:hypothetical protein